MVDWGKMPPKFMGMDLAKIPKVAKFRRFGEMSPLPLEPSYIIPVHPSVESDLRGHTATEVNYRRQIADTVIQRMVEQLAKQQHESLNAIRENAYAAAFRTHYITHEEMMKPPNLDEELFILFRAENGFYAVLKNGRTIVGVTLSQVTAAVLASLTATAIMADDDAPKPDEHEDEDPTWEKV